jgi:acetyl-CoA carboxylase biotin carboxyl carrier protein
MNLKEIKDLIRAVSASNLTEFKFHKEGLKISMKTDKCGHVISHAAPQMVHSAPMPVASMPSNPAPSAPAEAPAPAAVASEESNLLEIKSPIVGTFYRSSSPDKDAYVQVGDSVNVGSVVCIVEAMKLFNEIESEVAGKIVKVLVDDSTPIEYDQVLFLVDPNA